jgi:hypothetical protein
MLKVVNGKVSLRLEIGENIYGSELKSMLEVWNTTISLGLRIEEPAWG